MRRVGERNTSATHSSAPFFGDSDSGRFFGRSPGGITPAEVPRAEGSESSADRDSSNASISQSVSRVGIPTVQRQVQPAGSQSVAGMTLDEKWEIVYLAALRGAGDGVVMALTIILGMMVLFAIVSAIVAFLCPECIAAIAGFLSTVVAGAAVSSWLAALMISIGASAAITVLIREFRAVHQSVATAETVADLQTAGRNWGYRSGMALVDLFTSIMGLIPGIRRQAVRLARRLLSVRSGTPPTPPTPTAVTPPRTPPPARPAPAPAPAGPPPLPARPAPAPVPARAATAPPVRRPAPSPSIAQAAGHAFSMASRRILRYFGRDIVVVNTARGPHGFYRRTGTGGGRPPGHAGAQEGQWAPFDYITPDGLKKNRYYQVAPDDPLYGYGNEDFRAAGQWLDRQALPTGEDVGTDLWVVNDFLQALGCPMR